MTILRWLTVATVLVVAVSVAILSTLDKQETERKAQDSIRVAQQDRSIWQARYASAVDSVARDTVILRKLIPHWDTVYADAIADAQANPDSVAWADVLPILNQADSTIKVCSVMVRDCGIALRAADSTIAATGRERDGYKALAAARKPSWTDRCGVSAGVGAVRDGSVVRAGPSLNLGCKVWP